MYTKCLRSDVSVSNQPTPRMRGLQGIYGHYIFLPAPAPGLFIEMKAGKGRLTPGQVSFRDALQPHGYSFVVAYSWHDAAKAIADHVGFDAGI